MLHNDTSSFWCFNEIIFVLSQIYSFYVNNYVYREVLDENSVSHPQQPGQGLTHIIIFHLHLLCLYCSICTNVNLLQKSVAQSQLCVFLSLFLYFFFQFSMLGFTFIYSLFFLSHYLLVSPSLNLNCYFLFQLYRLF